MGEVSLLIEDQVFKLSKESLCEHSDYFRAMFSGSYVENEQTEIKINIVDAESMKYITTYIECGMIDLTGLAQSALSDLAISANFLQMVELLKQIEYTLDSNLTETTWFHTMNIAETSSFPNLYKYALSYGLYSFPNMTSELSLSAHKLYWYLSHPHLNSVNELLVFEFGFKYIQQHQLSADFLLIIIGCLDLKALTIDEIEKILEYMQEHFQYSLAESMTKCLYEIKKNGWVLSAEVIKSKRLTLVENYTESVYNEIVKLIKGFKERATKLVPVVSLSSNLETKAEAGPQFLYAFEENVGLEKWLEVAEKSLWGWSIAAWGHTKLVLVCGEYGRGTGVYMRDVLIYDTIKKSWSKHNLHLPPRRHAGVTVIENELFMVGGVGSYRIVSNSMIVYNLVDKVYRIAKEFPDALQSPSVCAHKGKLYVGGHRNVYRYEIMEGYDRWDQVLETQVRANYMASLHDYIYVTQNYFNLLLRFRPDIDMELTTYKQFADAVATMCTSGNRIIAFTQDTCGQNESVAVEEFVDKPICETKILWTKKNSNLKINDVAGCCNLIMNSPIDNDVVSDYVKPYLNRFS